MAETQRSVVTRRRAKTRRLKETRHQNLFLFARPAGSNWTFAERRDRSNRLAGWLSRLRLCLCLRWRWRARQTSGPRQRKRLPAPPQWPALGPGSGYLELKALEQRTKDRRAATTNGTALRAIILANVHTHTRRAAGLADSRPRQTRASAGPLGVGPATPEWTFLGNYIGCLKRVYASVVSSNESELGSNWVQLAWDVVLRSNLAALDRARAIEINVAPWEKAAKGSGAKKSKPKRAMQPKMGQKFANLQLNL